MTLVRQDDKRIRAHRILLSTRSPKFFTLGIFNMKKQCTKQTYHAYKHLKEEKEEIEERIEDIISKKSKMLWLIRDEKENDPIEEIFEFEETFDKMFSELKLKISEQNSTRHKECKYHSKGFCKHGSLCQFFHAKRDCKECMLGGQCTNSGCQDRHR